VAADPSATPKPRACEAASGSSAASAPVTAVVGGEARADHPAAAPTPGLASSASVKAAAVGAAPAAAAVAKSSGTVACVVDTRAVSVEQREMPSSRNRSTSARKKSQLDEGAQLVVSAADVTLKGKGKGGAAAGKGAGQACTRILNNLS
jgi:hypothetical protein